VRRDPSSGWRPGILARRVPGPGAAASLKVAAHANVWPDDDPGLRERARAYMAACLGLAERMLAWYGRALGWVRRRSRWAACRTSG